MGVQASDSNTAFTLTQIQRQQVIRAMTACVDEIPTASAMLIDHAGRVVEESSRPTGVNMQAISALAAGCYATTHELAKTVGQPEYSLLFQHDNGQQVYIWPVADRALLVALLKSAVHVPILEKKLAGEAGAELSAVITAAQAPEKRVPPPKVVLTDMPEEVRTHTRTLATLLADLQARSGGTFTPETARYLLQSRDELVRSLGRGDWKSTIGICEATRKWLAQNMGVMEGVLPGKVVPVLYRELLGELHGAVSGVVAPDRLEKLYLKFYALLAHKWPRVFVSTSYVSAGGLDVPALWQGALDSAPERSASRLAGEFAPALDEMVRELLRVVYLAKGADERRAIAVRLAGVVDKYRDWLLPLGLDGLVGRNWTPIGSS